MCNSRQSKLPLLYNLDSWSSQKNSPRSFWLNLRRILEFLGASPSLARMLTVCRAFKAEGERLLARRTIIALFNVYPACGYARYNFCFDYLTGRSRLLPGLPAPATAIACTTDRRLAVLSRGDIYSLRHKERLWTADQQNASGPNSPMMEANLYKQTQVKRCLCEAAYGILNDSLFVAGGYDGNSTLNEVWSYSFSSTTWISVPPLRQRRMQAAGATVSDAEGRDMFVVIGGKVRQGMALSSCEAFVPAINEWHSLPSLPYPSEISGCAAFDGKIFVTPVMSWRSQYAVWMLDLRAKMLRWTELSTFPNAKAEFSAPKLVFGGSRLFGFQTKAPGETLVHEYSELSDQWRMIPIPFRVPGLVSDDSELLEVPLECLGPRQHT